jgi:SAM-dependent methyltransferase
MLKRIPQLLRRLVLDIRYGGFTGGVTPSRYRHLGANETVSTDIALLDPLLGHELRHGDVFVDIGCGAGRVLNWVLADGRAKKIYGIELDADIANATLNRLKIYPNVHVQHGDAIKNIPNDGTLFYLWNPFQENVMIKFRDALITKYTKEGTLSSVRIVYHNSVHEDIWKAHSACNIEKILLPATEQHRAIRISFSNPQN